MPRPIDAYETTPSYRTGYWQGWLDAAAGRYSIISSTWPTWGDLPYHSTGYDEGHAARLRGESKLFFDISDERRNAQTVASAPHLRDKVRRIDSPVVDPAS